MNQIDIIMAHGAMYIAEMQASSELLKNRAIEKLERARQLPRKQKKLLKRDALLDWQFGCHADDVFKF